VDIIALSRGCEFAARAALGELGQIRSLAFLSPTGFGRADFSPKLAQLIRELQRSPRLAELLFRAMTSRAALLYPLLKSLDRATAFALASEAHRAARLPGASVAPFKFLEEALSAQTAGADLYKALRVPTFVLFAQDPKASFELLPDVTRENQCVRSLRLDSPNGVPHLECIPAVTSALQQYYQAIDVADRFEDWESTVETVPSFSRGGVWAA
jgi:pimeloyl-ACP methyl ester carboxylesterase